MLDWKILRAYLDRVPFVPFRIEKTGGVWFEVNNPAMASVSRRLVELGFPIENGGQRFVTIALMHIIRVEIVLPVSSA